MIVSAERLASEIRTHLCQRYYRVLCECHATAVNLCHGRFRTVAGMHQVALGRLGSMRQGPSVAHGSQTSETYINQVLEYDRVHYCCCVPKGANECRLEIGGAVS